MEAETAQTDMPTERARDGMIFVRAGIFWMGSDHHYPEEKPAHRVGIEGFFIDETPVTNAQFAAFVAATGYRTFAEFAPDPRDYPGILPEMLYAGSLVFREPAGRVDLRDWSQWWTFRKDANWRQPYGPRSSIAGLDDHPVVHVKVDNVYHAGWAWAGSTPHRSTKLIAAHFGGTRTPLAVSWPSKIKPDKTPRPQFHHVNDIVPTIYDILQITPPKLVDAVSQDPLDGTSMTYSFVSPTAPDHKKEQYFEVMGSRAYYKDGWIASTFGPRVPWQAGVDPSIMRWSPKNDVWELHDLEKDFSQAKDVAANPGKLDELKKAFEVSARDNKVYPVGGALWSAIFHPEDQPSNPAKTFNYTQEVVGVPEFTAPKLGSRSNLVTINADLQPDSKGVLYALGAVSGGIALWVEDGKLHYEYDLFEIERTQLETSASLPTGKVKIEVQTTRKANGARPASLDIVMRVDGKEVSKGRIPRAAPGSFTANDAFDVGRDSYSPVSLAYFDRKPFAFNGKIRHLKVDYLD